jgi:hypothetical protein
MYFRIAAEVVLAMFSVFGVYSAARLVMQKFFSDKRIFLAIEIRTDDDVSFAEGLIKEALGIYYLTSSSRIAVIVPKEMFCDKGLLDIVARYGVEYYIIEK